MQNRVKVAFIGGGNMAKALIAGISKSNSQNYKIVVSNPGNGKLMILKNDFGVAITTDNNAAIENADIIILAVKPQIIKDVILMLKKNISHDQLIISIAAGVSLGMLINWFDGYANILCAMPNLPAAINAGVTGIYAAKSLAKKFKEQANDIFALVGKNVWLEDESLMSALAAVSGSGPAFVFYLIEALENAAVHFGFAHDIARILALQTFFGGAQMAVESEDDAVTLRKKVTSAQGTTEKLITVLANAGLKDIVTGACQKAIERFDELSKKL